MLVERHFAIVLYAKSDLKKAKEEIISFLTGLSDIDLVYFWTPDHTPELGTAGKAVAHAHTYRIPYDFDAVAAVKECILLLQSTTEGLSTHIANKYLYFITDVDIPKWENKKKNIIGFATTNYYEGELDFVDTIDGLGSHMKETSGTE